jgi:hypothetical protein
MEDPARSPTPEGCRLTVVVASAHGPEPLERCLRALVPQVREGESEVVVAGTFSDAQAAHYPHVAFLPLPPRTTGPELWGEGIAHARGALVAATETLTVPSPTWVRDVLAGWDPARPIVGGAVEPTRPRGLVSWAAFFCDYGQFMRPLQRGRADELPGNNTVFERALLDRVPAFTHPAFWKTYWCQALEAAGVPLAADPAFVVYDAKAYRLVPFLTRRFRHGRCFAGMRRAEMSRARRALFAAGSPLLPAVLLTRILRRLVPKRRHVGALAASAPVIVLAVAAWSLGEAVGYAAGAGASCRHVY